MSAKHLVDELRVYGEVAGRARKIGDDAAYRRLLASIEAVTKEWKALEPERFWDPKDPAYQGLVKHWAAAREAQRDRS